MTTTIFSNCHLFDGVSEDIRGGMNIAIENGEIKEVSEQTIAIAGAHTHDCGGRFLMPGLLDLHFHAYSASF